MPDREYINFKDMCARFDVTPRTLRYYGILNCSTPIAKAGHALQPARGGADEVDPARPPFRLSLEDIRQWLLIYGEKGTQEQSRVWIRLADHRQRRPGPTARQAGNLDRRSAPARDEIAWTGWTGAR